MTTSRHEQLEAAVKAFHAEHPEVWRLFERFALEKIRQGFKHYGAKSVMERVRWETNASDRCGEFKINNNFVAFYARRFARLHPEHEGFFRTRRQTSRDSEAA